jgi:hypothetical protein
VLNKRLERPIERKKTRARFHGLLSICINSSVPSELRIKSE